jgi:hypothetical protein
MRWSDGTFVPTRRGGVSFRRATLTTTDIEALVAEIADRCEAWLATQGYGAEADVAPPGRRSPVARRRPEGVIDRGPAGGALPRARKPPHEPPLNGLSRGEAAVDAGVPGVVGFGDGRFMVPIPKGPQLFSPEASFRIAARDALW